MCSKDFRKKVIEPYNTGKYELILLDLIKNNPSITLVEIILNLKKKYDSFFSPVYLEIDPIMSWS